MAVVVLASEQRLLYKNIGLRDRSVMAQQIIQCEYWRGGLLESLHRVSVAVVEGRKVLLSRGNVSEPVFMRSCAKPFQCTTVVESGICEAYGLSPAEIAVISASHPGDTQQIRTVSSILRKAGLKTDLLKCGIQPPLGPQALRKLNRRKGEPQVLHNNCSGKHAGMLCACRLMGAPTDSYLEPSHPHQKKNLRTVARFTGICERDIPLATDGCSAPTFAVPLKAMAQAMATFATEDGPARRVREAMMTHPAMVTKLCMNLMSAAPGRIVTKSGAEGVYVCGFPEQGVGLALKVVDGSARPWAPVVSAVIRKLGLLPKDDMARIEKITEPVIKNLAGRTVGEIRVVL